MKKVTVRGQLQVGKKVTMVNIFGEKNRGVIQKIKINKNGSEIVRIKGDKKGHNGRFLIFEPGISAILNGLVNLYI